MPRPEHDLSERETSPGAPDPNRSSRVTRGVYQDLHNRAPAARRGWSTLTSTLTSALTSWTSSVAGYIKSVDWQGTGNLVFGTNQN
jgi:hypothetical protein